MAEKTEKFRGPVCFRSTGSSGSQPTTSQLSCNSESEISLNSAPKPKSVSPVWQFISLLAPTVLTGFYLVYGLVGLVLDEKNKLKWSDEALEVGILVTAIVIGMNALVMAYAWYHRLSLRHLLWISPIAHIAICLVLTIIVFFAV